MRLGSTGVRLAPPLPSHRFATPLRGVALAFLLGPRLRRGSGAVRGGAALAQTCDTSILDKVLSTASVSDTVELKTARIVVAYLCLAATAGLVGGCGQGEEDSPGTPAEAMLSVDQVRESFRDITGDQLELTPFPEELEGALPHVDYLSSRRIDMTDGDDPQTNEHADRLQATYGDFLIAVYRGDVPRVHDVPSVEKDGIRWLTLVDEIGGRGERAAAEKEYGRNVQLRWYPASGEREVTAEWERLDAALTEVLGRAQQR